MDIAAAPSLLKVYTTAQAYNIAYTIAYTIGAALAPPHATVCPTCGNSIRYSYIEYGCGCYRFLVCSCSSLGSRAMSAAVVVVVLPLPFPAPSLPAQPSREVSRSPVASPSRTALCAVAM